MPGELTKAELAPLWPQIAALGPQKLVFTGGEPFMRADIIDLIRGFREADSQHSVVCCLNTNGHGVSPRIARALVGLVDEIRVSIDALARRNDALRGSGSFDTALRAIETFYEAGFEPKALVTFTAVSAPDLEDLLCLLLQKGIVHININQFRPAGRGATHFEWRLDLREAEAAVQRARRRCGLEPRPGMPEAAVPRRNCGVGQFVNIMPNGDVFPCHMLTQREFFCGSIREQSLLAICGREGLLDKLTALDLSDLALRDPRLRELSKGDACMGTTYVWSSARILLPDHQPETSI